jgi:hypothetical protein
MKYVFCVCYATVIGLLSQPLPSHAQGNFSVVEKDIPALKLNHYYTADKKMHEADFDWTFTKDTFTLKKGKGAIPAHLLNELLPDGVTADEIQGKWKFQGGKLVLSEIKAGKKDGRKEASLSIFKTAPTVIRIGFTPQYVFALER